MKYLRNALAALALLIAFAAVLLWFLPARWAMPWIEPHLHGLHLQQVHGSVWNGSADAVTDAGGARLGQLHWQVSRRALLGQLRLRLAFDGPQLTFSGSLQRLAGDRVEADGWHVRADLAALDAYAPTPLGQPLGELQASIERLQLQGGWPLQLQAHGRWQQAAVRTTDGTLDLGDMHAQAQAQGGVIQAHWHDAGDGPLQVQGQLQLSPLGWRLDTTLRARQSDPILQRWLARLGPVSPDGSVHIRQSGGLAGNPLSTDKGKPTP